MNAVIDVQQLSYRYTSGGPAALRDITLQVPHGAALALLGPNGAGKTTLLDLVLGWRKPESGKLLVESSEPSMFRRRDAGRLMSLVAQSEHISFSFSVIDYVLFGRTPHLSQLSSPAQRDWDIAREALSQVNILHLSDRLVTRLSGGETQLVKLARSIAQDTSILLLDEPTSDLDPGNTTRVIDIMRARRNQGITQVFTTHDPMLASDIATHAALIRGGELLYFGPPGDALTRDNLSTLYGTDMAVEQVGDRRVIIRGR